MTPDPTVTVVIPTLGRPSLRAAVESALQQTQVPLEVVVGADTDLPLDIPDDPTVRVIRCGPRAGGNTARTVAIDAARGDLIALLDDDDEWEPLKLRAQLAKFAALQLSVTDPWVISGRVVDTDGSLRPAALIGPEDHPLAYLLEKRSIRGGVGKIHTSTLLFPRWMVEAVPFDRAVKFYQDPTWYIHLLETFPDVRFVQCPEALAVIHEPMPVATSTGTTGSVSGAVDWRRSAGWVAEHSKSLHPRWRGDYVLVETLARAMRSDDRSQHFQAFVAAFRLGRPGPAAVLYALAKLTLYNVHRLRRPA